MKDKYFISTSMYVWKYGCFDKTRFPSGTVIGNYCSIASEVRYLNANHPIEYVTTHPLFCNKALGGVQEDKIQRSNLEIGHDVWIGYGTVILSGCQKIGTGAVIGAGSVVTKDIEPYGIYVGVPAKMIRKRFVDAVCQELEESQWYLKAPEELLRFEKEIESPEDFLEKIKGRYNV